MTVRELLMEIHLSKAVQSISTKMYYVLFTKILQEFVVETLDRYTYKVYKIPF